MLTQFRGFSRDESIKPNYSMIGNFLSNKTKMLQCKLIFNSSNQTPLFWLLLHSWPDCSHITVSVMNWYLLMAPCPKNILIKAHSCPKHILIKTNVTGLCSGSTQGVWFEELKFNKHCSTFVLFDKKFPILD
jgi:hypothetical protein